MKSCVVFLSKPQWEVGFPYLGFDNEQFKRQIMGRLKEKFRDIEFTGGPTVVRYEPVEMQSIKDQVRHSDALILYTIGFYGEPGLVKAGIELIEMRVPTILVNSMFGGDYLFVQFGQVANRSNPNVLEVSSQDIADLEEAVELLHRVVQLKGKRILNLTVDKVPEQPGENEIKMLNELTGAEIGRLDDKQRQFIQEAILPMHRFVDVTGTDQAHQWRRDVDRYSKNMKELFDFEMVRPEPGEFYEFYKRANEAEATKLAEKWINEAEAVDPTKQTIENSAKLYSAMREFMKAKKCDAITTDCGTLMISGYLPAYPCLAFFEMAKQAIVGCCESDMDSTISHLFGLYVAHRPGFVSNYSIDLSHGNIVYLHCVASNRPFGTEGPSAGYYIKHHGESHFMGASPLIEFPTDEDVTTIKISVLEKKMLIRSGKSVGFLVDDNGCRNKLLVRSETRKVLENHDFKTFGWHTVSFFGDLRKEFESAAKLLGLEVVEEDK